MLQLPAGAPPPMASKKHQATVEDCSSDDDSHGPGQQQGVPVEPSTPEPSPGRANGANVRTRRSKPEDMGSDRPLAGGAAKSSDVKSDSGYSSQSVAGMSSADSAASATSQRSPPAHAVPAASPAARPPHRRQESTQSTQSTQSAQSTQGTQSAPRLPRRDSQTSRRPAHHERRPTVSHAPPKRRDSRNHDCTVPGCTKCGPDAADPRPRTSRRQSWLPPPAESAPDISHRPPHLDTRSQLSDPAPYPPPSPRDSRPPRYYTSQGGPVVQPAITPMQRRPSVNSRSARPTSYHGDPNYNNWPHAGAHPSRPSPPHEHGPPPSRSAYGTMPYPQPQMGSPYMPPYPPQGPPQGPPPAAFFQARQMQPTNEQRPHLQARVPTSGYDYSMAPPVMHPERNNQSMPSARYHPTAVPPQPLAQRRPLQIEQPQQDDYDDFQSDSESEYEEEQEHRYPSQPTRRPSVRHANTTPVVPQVSRPRPQAVVVPPPRDSRPRDRTGDARSSRRASMNRPPLVPVIKSRSAYDTPTARVIVEGSRSSRRESGLVYERTAQEPRKVRQEYNEPRRTHRSSRVYDNAIVSHDFERQRYDDDDDDEEEEAVGPATRRPLGRRNTDADPRRRSQRPVEIKQAAVAEDYISSRRGEPETVADRSYAAANKRSSRISGGPSEAESSRSSRSDNNGEIRLRIGNDAPVTLNLSGDMEGRTLQLVPIENGINELVISSNARGSESTYRSERGSIKGERRAITSASQARRDAEELTERSSQTSRRRRETRTEHDDPRRLLQRQRERDRREQQYRH